MMRVALIIEYDGTAFHGWQIQAHDANQDHPTALRTTQQELEKAISCVANEPISTICAGRTDKGVHARFQVVHFDTNAIRTPRAWVLGCNTYLPFDITVRGAAIMPESFNARLSARERRYHYVIDNRPTRPALDNNRVTWIPQQLDVDKMHQAAQLLIGEHDFSAFRDKDCQAAHAIRTLYEINIKRDGNIIDIDIAGNAFLHHMVRNIVGVLLPIGQNKKPITYMQQVLQSQKRTEAGVTAPAAGLYLNDVIYEDPYQTILAGCYDAF